MLTRNEAATAYVDRFIETPFQWGPGTDCAGRVCWYLDQIDRLPDHWREGMAAPREDAWTARLVMKRLYRAVTFAKVCSGAFAPIAPLKAATGDLAGVPAPSERDPAVGVVIGGSVFVSSPHGLQPRSLTAASAAWRVPD